ncbi:MAG TPA: long-chain fatty acid--CoA ligase [Kiritimatiellia bacterium]|nr:long-chain fatty acid--CoA ligase [Kiritimatiellia bacterium]
MTEQQHSLVDLARASARTYGDLPAIVFNGRTTTHAAFDQISDRVAAGLAERGIGPGDRVGLYCVNSDAFAFAYFGILKAGATVVPVNLLLNPKEVAYILKDAGVKGLIYFELFAEAVKSLRDQVPGVGCRVCIGANNPLGDVSFTELLSCTTPPLQHSIDPSSLAAILYTSGTTGHPKGAMLSHRNLASNVDSIREALQLTPGKDVLLCVLPMFHAFAATVCMIFPLTNGCTVVPVPKFDPQQVADLVATHHVTVLPMVPSMFSVLLRLPDSEINKFASLHYAVSGGAAMPVEVMRQFEAKFGKFVYEGDGPTECSPVTCVNPIGGVRKPASVGLPVPRVEMKIVDERGHEVPHGTIGEIVVRGPNVMKGYWNHPEETKEAFFGEWFRTGDLGTEDDDGYFYIVDRKKDMIIVNGMNVYPRVIEEVLYKHPAVREAAVVGDPDELHGEIPVAYVSLKEGAEATPQALRQYCRDNLGRHEVPRKFTIIPQLPKNAAGKILKRELRKTGEHERGVDAKKL